jgi:hypothetical protein
MPNNGANSDAANTAAQVTTMALSNRPQKSPACLGTPGSAFNQQYARAIAIAGMRIPQCAIQLCFFIAQVLNPKTA